MRKVCTIYWDEENHTHHTIISEVEDNGAHKVVESYIYDNMLSAAWSAEVATERYGCGNVRLYKVKEERF